MKWGRSMVSNNTLTSTTFEILYLSDLTAVLQVLVKPVFSLNTQRKRKNNI